MKPPTESTSGANAGSADAKSGTWAGPRNDVQSFEFDGRLILVNRTRQSLTVLNDGARLIWEMLGAGIPRSEIGALLAERYGIPTDVARADVEAVLRQSRVEALISTEDAAGAISPPASEPVRWPRRFAATRVYALCGRPLRFRFGSASLQALIHPLLAPWENPSNDAKDTIYLFRDGRDHIIATHPDACERARDVEHAVGGIINSILDLSYPEARWLAIMHAGAAARDGRAVILPGASGSGKSTLTTALTLSGFFYLSDDVVPLDGRTMRVMPMPFAACIKPGSWPVITDLFPGAKRRLLWADGNVARRYLDLSDATSHTAAAGVAPAAFVFPRYDLRAPANITRLAPLDSLQRLLDARCWLSLDIADLSAFLRHLRNHDCYAVTYPSLSEGIQLVRTALSS